MRKLLALALALVLSGCAALPMEVDVQQGPELLPASQQDFSYYSPSGPTEGASPQEIVSGFLAAGTGPQGDYAVAREFLSESFASRWKPDTQTLIRVGVPIFQSATESLQVVQLSVGARIDEQGRYQNLDSQDTNLRFQMVQEDGEWRIASAPNLTVVTLPVFSVVFNALPVFFLDTTSTHLIPDLRWFPARTSTPTRLVTALLDGPSEWLERTVISAIPTGTGLTVNAVRVEAGVAYVDFDANALEADGRQRGLMLTQLISTLQQLPGVSEVSLSVNGAPQAIEATLIATPAQQTTTFALTEDSVVRLSGSEAGALANSAELVRELQPNLLAVDSGGANLALASAESISWVAFSNLGSATRDIDPLGTIRVMQFDPDSRLFVYPELAEETIRVFSPSGDSRELELGLTGELIDAQLSAEGSRLAVVVAEDNSVNVQVFGVLRDVNGQPLSLVPGLSFEPILGQPLSLSWHNQTRLRLLERTASGLTALSEYPLTGPRSQLNMPPAVGKKLEAGSALISSYLLSETAEVWVLTSNTWRRVQEKVVDISTGR